MQVHFRIVDSIGNSPLLPLSIFPSIIPLPSPLPFVIIPSFIPSFIPSVIIPSFIIPSFLLVLPFFLLSSPDFLILSSPLYFLPFPLSFLLPVLLIQLIVHQISPHSFHRCCHQSSTDTFFSFLNLLCCPLSQAEFHSKSSCHYTRILCPYSARTRTQTFNCIVQTISKRSFHHLPAP